MTTKPKEAPAADNASRAVPSPSAGRALLVLVAAAAWGWLTVPGSWQVLGIDKQSGFYWLVDTAHIISAPETQLTAAGNLVLFCLATRPLWQMPAESHRLGQLVGLCLCLGAHAVSFLIYLLCWQWAA